MDPHGITRKCTFICKCEQTPCTRVHTHALFNMYTHSSHMCTCTRHNMYTHILYMHTALHNMYKHNTHTCTHYTDAYNTTHAGKRWIKSLNCALGLSGLREDGLPASSVRSGQPLWLTLQPLEGFVAFASLSLAFHSGHVYALHTGTVHPEPSCLCVSSECPPLCLSPPFILPNWWAMSALPCPASALLSLSCESGFTSTQ